MLPSWQLHGCLGTLQSPKNVNCEFALSAPAVNLGARRQASRLHPTCLALPAQMAPKGSGTEGDPSEALPVHDGGAGLVVLPLGDPHLLEGGQRGQDGPTDPHGVLALGWGYPC